MTFFVVVEYKNVDCHHWENILSKNILIGALQQAGRERKISFE